MKKRIIALVIATVAVVAVPATTFASPQGRLNQVINAGALSTDIVDGSGATVATPSFNMTTTTVKTTCQTITGTYGDNAQRVAVDNPGGANAGWNLTIAATGGSATTWTDGGTNTYKFNDAAGSGCTTGQLTLDPSISTLGLTGASTSTGVTKGTSAAFVSGSTDSITLMSADASSDDIWNGYLTGIGVSQKVPANTPAGTYTIHLTQTATAS